MGIWSPPFLGKDTKWIEKRIAELEKELAELKAELEKRK